MTKYGSYIDHFSPQQLGVTSPPSGGGGSGSDPNAVQKTGDTMTGQLIIKGDQFDGGIAPPVPALMIENSTGGDPIGIAIGKYGDSVCFVKANGAGANIRMPPGAFLTFADSGGNDAVQINVSAGFIKLVSALEALNICCDANGDLVVVGTGVNNGKSVNLTAGKWV